MILVTCQYSINARTIEKHDFQSTNKVSSEDWAQYNSDGSRIAIIRTKSVAKRFSIGTSLEIYSTDSHYQPKDRLFLDNHPERHFFEMQWVGSECVYLTVEGFQSAEQIWAWLDNISDAGLQSLSERTRIGIWPKPNNVSPELSSMRYVPPGNILSSQRGSDLVVFNPLSEWIKYFNPQSAEMDNEFLSYCGLYLYKLPEGHLISNSRAKLPFPAPRWWSKRGQFIPLQLIEDGKTLIGIISRNISNDINAQNQIPFLVAINMSQGDIVKVSPDSSINGLSVLGNVRYFAPGNPTVLSGERSAIFNLSLNETVNNLVMRFGIFNLSGEKIEEIHVFEDDLERAGVPKSFPIAWMRDGKRVLVQAREDVWLLDYRDWTGYRVAKNVIVEDIVGCLPKGLYVRARNSDSHYKDTGAADTVWGTIFFQEEYIQ